MDPLVRDPSVEPLLGPVWADLCAAVRRVEGDGATPLRVGFDAGADVRLDRALLGPDPFIGFDRGLPGGIDRWRRAAAAVLEGVVERREPATVGRNDWRAWARLGPRAAAAWPELGVAAADLSLFVTVGDLCAAPRAGAAIGATVLREDPDGSATLDAWARGVGPDPTEFARWVRRVLSGTGPRAASAPIPDPPARDVPLTLGPWSWARLDVPAHPRGGWIEREGTGWVEPEWAVGGQPLAGLAVAGAEALSLSPRPGGPVGRWTVSSALGFGQILGARGVVFVFHPSGRFELVLADSFVGPLAAAEIAHTIGSSGWVVGRWRVVGPWQLVFDGLSAPVLTLQRKDADPVPLPTDATWIPALGEAAWQWSVSEAGLVLRGSVYGTRVEVRLRVAS